ncbi:hypothetical protein FAF44_44555 [Nonomuraea sp. MG754425]|uniref:hypothetical protein n=1 Tax=Nonomuraea sp. MG754425 TaxID=2570319 RepID=UPI001F2010DB|nr:hypothetical protein [Nonomuraea sp. MG754425]MCF6475384.1 hypothetical protein [Nonomuraea sp. MG754425]
MDGLLENLRELWSRSASRIADPIGILTYGEVVEYLALHRPGVRGARGVLCRERAAGRWYYRLFYIDEHDAPVFDAHGRLMAAKSVLAARCDEELTELFGGADMIIIE